MPEPTSDTQLDDLVAAMMEIASIQTDLLQALDPSMREASFPADLSALGSARRDEQVRLSKVRELRDRSQGVLRWLLARQGAKP